MDWMDAYLDGLSDGRNAVYPPDKNTWTATKPSAMQQSMMQEAMVMDLQQLRFIQEMRQSLEAPGPGADGDGSSATGREGPVPTPTPAAQFNILSEQSDLVITQNNQNIVLEQQ